MGSIFKSIQGWKFSALVNLRYEWFTDVFAYESNDEQEFKTTAFVPRIGFTYEVSKTSVLMQLI